MTRARQDLDQPPADQEGTSLNYEETLIAELDAKIGHDHQPSKRIFLGCALGCVWTFLSRGAVLIAWGTWIRSLLGPAVAPVNHRVDASAAHWHFHVPAASVTVTRADRSVQPPAAGRPVRV